MLKLSSHQSKKKFMNVVRIVHIGRNIHIFLIYNVIYYNLLINLIIVGKFFIKIDVQENEVMPLLHEALQLLESITIILIAANLYITIRNRVHDQLIFLSNLKV